MGRGIYCMNAPGKVLCDGTTRDGKPCRRYAVPGRGKCMFHGGSTNIGPAHGRYKDGRYGKYMPGGLAGAYQEARRDPELLSLKDEVALLTTRIGELVQQLDTGQTRQSWSQLRQGVGKLRQDYEALSGAVRKGDAGQFVARAEAIGASLQVLEERVRAGGKVEEVWEQLAEAVERRARVARAEWKRLAEMKQVVSAEQALGLVVAVMMSVKRHVTDKQTIRLIANEIGSLVAQPPPDYTPPPGALDFAGDVE
jgi:hypothetical protein